MRTFLGMLMLLIVSGDDKTNNIKGNLGDSVLLPCVCSDRNLNEEFLWQMDKPNRTAVYKYSGNTSNFNGRYIGRAKTFLSENKDNCSILLINITEEDLGTYRCSFNQEEVYRKILVNLSLSERMGPTNINHATYAPIKDIFSTTALPQGSPRHRFLNSIPVILLLVLVLCVLLRCS